MDSLTQIVLGAACGEAVLGKKIGNKALLFGAIGGTIPDLDVIVGNLLFGNEIDAMLFHRGFMHSIFFAISAAFVFGWLTFKLYNSRKRKDSTTLKEWILLFFWALFTHPILDSFTPYGTQLFAPFSNYRVAFNNVAVVDLTYTLPFLICVIVLMFYKRASRKRLLWWRLGVGISSFYLLVTFINKLYIDSVFEDSLKAEHITYSRAYAQPTLFNNILWYGVSESDSSYHVAYYSYFDKERKFSDWMTLPKERALKPVNHKRISELEWFSNNYYSIYDMGDDTYRYNDLRYPLSDPNNPNSSVFSFRLYDDNGSLNMKPFERTSVSFSDVFRTIWERLKGK